MNLLKRTWATGAMPIGAPGWPELAWKVASTWRRIRINNWSFRERETRSGQAQTARWGKIIIAGQLLRIAGHREMTYREGPDGVDGELINLSVRHDGQKQKVWMSKEKGWGKEKGTLCVL
jgi:hypothetical protein